MTLNVKVDDLKAEWADNSVPLEEFFNTCAQQMGNQ